MRLGIPNTEASAEVDGFCLKAVKITHFCGKSKHNICRIAKGRTFKDLRADVTVISAKAHRGKLQNLPYELLCLPRFNRRAKLRVDLTRRDLLLRVGVDAGRQAQKDLLRNSLYFP